MPGAGQASRPNRPKTVVRPPGVFPPAAASARRITLAACYGLLALLFLRTGLSLSMVGAAGLTAWGIQALPLLALLPGLHRERPRSYAWMGFVMQLYFIHGVILAFSPARLGWGLAQVALSVTVFVALIWFIRQQGR